jgi:pimeloyl-ACP methyl ester carboxylesterase
MAETYDPGACPLKFVDANGLKFAYLEEGSGPLVLLLHGFPDTAHSWDHVRPLIAKKGYRVVAPFMRGYAPTGIPDRDPDQEIIARDALALITALGAESAVVVGHDWGAAAAYGAASLEPARVEKLITVAIPHPAAVTPTPRILWSVRHFVAYKLPGAPSRFAKNDFAALRAIYRRWSPTWNPPDEEFAAVKESFRDPASLRAAFGYYRSLSPVLPRHMRGKIAVPTVSFCGATDPGPTEVDFERARSRFTSDYTIESMSGGHFLHREHPDEFATRLLRHL